MRKKIGKISYDKNDHVEEDEDREAARQELLTKLKKARTLQLTREHLKRMSSVDGLAQSIYAFFDKDDLPPSNLSLFTLTLQYKRLYKQIRWLETIQIEIFNRMEKIDKVRFIKERAKVIGVQREMREEREKLFQTAMNNRDSDHLLPTKLMATLREALAIELARRQAARHLTERPLSTVEFLPGRQIAQLMKYLFYDELGEEKKEMIKPAAEHYEFLWYAALEINSVKLNLDHALYEIRELVESADVASGG